MWPDFNINKCYDCNESCKSCSGPNANNCLTCNTGYKVKNSMCVYICALGCQVCTTEKCIIC